MMGLVAAFGYGVRVDDDAGRVREAWDALAAAVLAEAWRTNSPVDRVLRRVFQADTRAARGRAAQEGVARAGLGGAGRRAVAARVHATSAWRLTHAYALGLGVAPTVEQLAAAAAALVAREGACALREATLDVSAILAGAAEAVRAPVIDAGEPPLPDDPTLALAVLSSLPPWIAARWRAELGDDGARALARASSRPGPIGVRARVSEHAGLVARMEAEGVVATPMRYAPLGFVLTPSSGPSAPARVDVRGSPSLRARAFEVQDEGSQLVVEACVAGGTRPLRVLDACAGAGGKTLALLDRLGPEVRIVAADVDAARIADLRGRLVGHPDAARVELRVGGPEVWGDAPYALVLVDGPCTALGTWRRGPDRRWHVGPGDAARHAATNRALLAAAARALAPGGRLVFSTCTLLHEENEAVADTVALPPVGVFDGALASALGASPRVTLRPDVHGTDGFFIAAWRAPPGAR
jgi:16S rRNA (cytosine967-C5)-methyltransferase